MQPNTAVEYINVWMYGDYYYLGCDAVSLVEFYRRLGGTYSYYLLQGYTLSNPSTTLYTHYGDNPKLKILIGTRLSKYWYSQKVHLMGLRDKGV
jgi:hypothetical protein